MEIFRANENILKTEQNMCTNDGKHSGVNIDFRNLTNTVKLGKNHKKLILNRVNGRFLNGQLSVLIGPSGSGKTTLLNVLSGYNTLGVTGELRINGFARDLNSFLKTSSYIMQDDIIPKMLTVGETMMLGAHLRLGYKHYTVEEKRLKIAEVLQTLRMHQVQQTFTEQLSGGERKRLSIALELIKNPRVLFLDEPTTGLDNVTSYQCIQQLKQIAENGCTIICSIHSPSAKLFALFDWTYVLSQGECAYQGYGPNIVSFVKEVNLVCPTSYNPADFIIETCCGEYGNFQNELVAKIDNGHKQYVNGALTSLFREDIDQDADEERSNNCKSIAAKQEENDVEWYREFVLLTSRTWLQMWRNKGHFLFQLVLYALTGALTGIVFNGTAVDASKMLSNYGFYATTGLFFLYIPMMSIVIHFPNEVRHVKREHFNRWYRLNAYYCALTVSTVPLNIVYSCIFLTCVCLAAGQPFDFQRYLVFFAVGILTGITSETIGIIISTVFNVMNSLFLGTVVMSVQLVIASLGIGYEYGRLPLMFKILMSVSYLRYHMVGSVNGLFRDQPKLHCPDDQICPFVDPNEYIGMLAIIDRPPWIDMCVLFGMFVVLRIFSYNLLKQVVNRNGVYAIAKSYVKPIMPTINN